MTRFITTISLANANRSDLQSISKELKKIKFEASEQTRPGVDLKERFYSFIRSSNESLVEITHSVSNALASTGKRFPFTVRKEKPTTY
jgi:hypothetical protein